jgi:hypothetical protein
MAASQRQSDECRAPEFKAALTKIRADHEQAILTERVGRKDAAIAIYRV